jgi:hypothetical protein
MKAAWFALALATLALVAWIAVRRAPGPAPHDAAAIAASLERIERAQAAQEARLAALERRGAPAWPTVPARAASARASTVPALAHRAGNGAPADAATAHVQLQAQLHALDDRLVRDPLSPDWAARQERAVDAFVAPASLAREHLPAPVDRDTRCQSSLCRIRLRYADEETAQRAQVALLLALAPTLPHAQSFLLVQPDGAVDLVVYAGDEARAVR